MDDPFDAPLPPRTKNQGKFRRVQDEEELSPAALPDKDAADKLEEQLEAAMQERQERATKRALHACSSITITVLFIVLVGLFMRNSGIGEPKSPVAWDGSTTPSKADAWHSHQGSHQAPDDVWPSSSLPPPPTPTLPPPPSASPSPPPPSPSPSPPLSPSPPPPPPPTTPSPSPAPPPPAEIAFYVSVLKAPYESARAICERQGGVLAVPTTRQTNTALTGLLTATPHKFMWLGANDDATEGQWDRRVRTPGDTSDDPHGTRVRLEYTNWHIGTPDGGTNENCAEMWTTGEWNDARCNDARNPDRAFACEVAQPPEEGFEFACSDGMANPTNAPRCTYEIHGANGRNSPEARRVDPQKHEFRECRELCEGHNGGGQVAEPRTAEQLQYLARALRRSGDDSMWIGLTHLGGTNFQWLSGAILNAADSSWAHRQPDSGDGCVEMWGDATWNDRPCRGDNWAHKVCACEVPVA